MVIGHQAALSSEATMRASCSKRTSRSGCSLCGGIFDADFATRIAVTIDPRRCHRHHADHPFQRTSRFSFPEHCSAVRSSARSIVVDATASLRGNWSAPTIDGDMSYSASFHGHRHTAPARPLGHSPADVSPRGWPICIIRKRSWLQCVARHCGQALSVAPRTLVSATDGGAKTVAQ